tara:strand:+ start:18345 stop:19112 length:768 start_codon:yes stop_codon:yes gene_type:complete
MHTLIPIVALAFLSPGSESAAEAAPLHEVAPPGATTMESGAWILRVGGEPEAELASREGPEGPLYRAGRVATDTKLPVGYPAPTPPGAIELKHYPSIRRAEFSAQGGPGRMGQNGFWPLFQHITRNDIAMTAPVEMEYADTDADQNADQWTMAFLYHTTENGPTGEDGQITIIDTQPKTFLSIGVRGRRGWDQTEELAARLDAWLASNPGWTRTGLPRTLGYNGPNVRVADQWWEVQIPVEMVTEDSAEASVAAE